MTAKFIVEVVKSLFGISDSSSNGTAETETSITVEREPDAVDKEPVEEVSEVPEDETEADVEEDETEVDVEESEVEEVDVEAEETDGDDVESPAVGEIDGIGPTYSERLSGAGIETVADLAATDLATIAETAAVSDSRAQDWLDQAQDW